jgi:hypothetical protein
LSIHDIPDFPAFDMFSGEATAPYRGFGGVVQDPSELERQFHAEAAQLRNGFEKTFRAKLESYASIPKELDSLIEKMWETGWDPRGSLNLFTRDFGLLLFEAMLGVLGGKPSFRSPGDDNVYIHNSIFWLGVRGVSVSQGLQVSDGDRGRINGLLRAGRRTRVGKEGFADGRNEGAAAGSGLISNRVCCAGDQMLKFIDSNGSPLIMLERDLLPYWGGSDNIGGVTNPHRNKMPFEGPSDYDRGCEIRGWIAPLQVHDRAGVVFWGDHLGLALVRESANVFFAVRPYYEIENLEDHVMSGKSKLLYERV